MSALRSSSAHLREQQTRSSLGSAIHELAQTGQVLDWRGFTDEPSFFQRFRAMTWFTERLQVAVIIRAACTQWDDMVDLFACDYAPFLETVSTERMCVQPSASTAHACVAS
jgi:hypothetical protein